VPIDCEIGQQFDFTQHEVVFDSAVPGCKKNEIIYVMESGYKVGERVLRVAKVGVAKGEE